MCVCVCVCVRLSFAHIVHHEGGDGPADLVVGFGFAARTQQDEQKPVNTRVILIVGVVVIVIDSGFNHFPPQKHVA